MRIASKASLTRSSAEDQSRFPDPSAALWPSLSVVAEIQCTVHDVQQGAALARDVERAMSKQALGPLVLQFFDHTEVRGLELRGFQREACIENFDPVEQSCAIAIGVVERLVLRRH